MRSETDTIAAIATPFGNSGIGIIRISGSDAIKKSDEIIRSRSGKSLGLISMESHTVHYGYVVDNGTVIDEVLCTIYRTPRSFTAEDTVEISCHGGRFVLDKVLNCILSSGIRLAEPGEFTKRAFMNGRIDLSQAESVMDLISSENEFSRANALSQLRGSLKEKVEIIREKILHETAFIEACLDDPEHYESGEEYKKKLYYIINNIIKEIDAIIDDSEKVVYLKNGINTIIAGKPNVGKSSLLNMLTGYERAIVTSIPGTTRDTVSERIDLDGIILNITDTAGIRETIDEVETIGVLKAKEEIDKADLILFILDISEDLDENDRTIADLINGKTSIAVLNKTDKISVINEEDVREITDSRIIKMSVKDNTGIEELKILIKQLFINDEIKESGIYITNKRQINLFQSAVSSLIMVKKSIDNGMSEDIYTVDLMNAYAYLGEIIGENVADDLADKIFSEFCMGK